ncbi:MAG: aldehyde dehydrogenase family protein, partial [Rhodobacteraceae bacterium]|nr:aldehyde dehydrogenase family protein [Paracoccaceae bacterium]
MYPDLELFIGGKWRKTTRDIPVVNPATEEEIGRLPHAEKIDLDDALEAAERGFKIWSSTAPRDRADIILRAATILRQRQEEIALTITLEHGKPLPQARMEVIRGAEFFEWDAGEAMRTYGRVIPAAAGNKISVHHHPVGVVAAFSPWNFPMSQPARKIAGALASGCSIILKAAEETPGGAIHIVRAFEEAGLPAGVLNLVFGTPSEISEYLIPQAPVRLVALTGSTAVGRHLTTLASQHMTPVLMELGGHAPVIVCEDTDVEKAAISGAIRKMRNAGQVCTSPTRFFVHESIFDQYAEKLVKRAAATVVGNGMEAGVEMGPTANDRRIPVLSGLVEDARAKGGEIKTGGTRQGNVGYFFQPTVLANVPDEAQIMQEE